MNLTLDILRLILLLLRINDIKSLCLVDKTFNNLCNEKSLWLAKFKEKDLTMINNEINIFTEFLNEYRKVSYAKYATDCLIDMINDEGFNTPFNMCWVSPYLPVNDMINISPNDRSIFEKVINIKYDTEKYINVNVQITGNTKGRITYYFHETYDDISIGHTLSTETYDNNDIIISLIIKILYHPLITINDFNSIPIIITGNKVSDDHQHIFDKRKEYVDECYSKYEQLYF